MTTSTQTTPVKWEDDALVLLDQTRLPVETIYLRLTTAEEVWGSIRRLEVRGAPAIGMAAAYGLYLGIRGSEAQTYEAFWQELNRQADYLGTSRPTAVNLFWALDRIKARVKKDAALPIAELKAAVLDEALAIQKEDAEVCRTIGEHLLTLLQDGMGVLTHCNPGALATAAYGTATAPFYLAKERGWNLKVYADETRPVLQGARLTAYELQQAGIDVTLICDNMAAMVMSQGKVQAVVVGTDRVAANGDVANKIGTYGVAVLAKAHGIPFYVAAPLSSVDLATPTGADIPIEERPAEEITHGLGKQVAPDDIKVYNPAFDVTPAQYITAIVTETGIFKPEEIAKSKQ
ncbi:methylthioribose-1-phosphate isomerase 1 [Brevibacillus agri]|uniref:Methylthioribose-1-phosphate isomerase n=1 Tax=Brevibacillus agri TaxID=51101 RepID=A0A3M8AS43_9BACL|nr:MULTISPECIES: S-methyl-5-thioribose-1-phosphate isomerase [Brevibacillus]ELK44029.1 methylthioribose-1-phosphate isomerase [Brevibacillus agri BAB-2500]EJL47799.1 S-methyl-5-thioribose-1-phosphate isomerase [Brevibacillus sp. CF112]MBG9568009.1 methylthioribose-1-phosphate isomerase [Brevibacillus agri]MBY0050689.1 S-methyl-5-thioribose-1-phosphate isomerase [Brevibacillus agri]MCG5253794.1 S-methyl-5-thioribose-1-phosphate isomerase [Brevibacillus agri]